MIKDSLFALSKISSLLGGHIGTKIYASWRTFWCFLNLLLLDVSGSHIMNLCDASHKLNVFEMT